MTHDPEQEHTAGGESSDRPFEPVPVESASTARTGADREVLSGPGGPEREHTPGAGLRGLWRRQSLRTRAVTAAATVVVLGLGGTVAYAAGSGGSPGDGDSPAASGPASPSPDGPGGRYGHGPWFGLGGVHGEATVKDRDTGEWVVRTWQRGTVEKVDGDQVTVRSEDGAEWTWTVNSDTRVHRAGTGADALKKGEKAYLVGTRSGDGTRAAARVLAGDSKVEERGKDKGPGDRRGHFRGHGPRDWRAPVPSASPSGSGARA